MTRQNRRRFLTTAGAAGLSIGLAGCMDTVSDYTGYGDGGNGGDGPLPAEDGTGDSGRSGEVLEDFSDGVDAWYDLDSNGEFSEADDVSNGEAGIRLTAGEGEAYVGATRAFDDPVDLSGTNLSISFRAASPRIHRVEIQLVAPDESNLVELNRSHTGPLDYWMWADLGATGEEGDPDLSEVYEMRLIGRDRAQEEAIDITVDEIRVHDAPDQGRVMLTWDDNHGTQYRAFELMSEYDFPGVEGVITHSVGNGDRLTVHQLREMAEAGWDVVSHPHHPEQGGQPLIADNFSEDEISQVMQDSIDWLQQRGLEDGSKYVVTPGNLRDATHMELLKEHHEKALGYGGGPVGQPITNPYAIGRFDGYDPEDVTEYVDFAAKYNQLTVPMWHTIGEQGDQVGGEEVDITVEQFEDLLQYIEDADVEVVTLSDL